VTSDRRLSTFAKDVRDVKCEVLSYAERAAAHRIEDNFGRACVAVGRCGRERWLLD
jgi:hypothetical protein